MISGKKITEWLGRTNSFWFSLYTALTAFCLYSCVYGFRKAFSAATFDDLQFLHVSYKVWLVTSQVIGYALSKFIGIKIIAELKSDNRARSIAYLVLVAGISLLLFAFVPPPWNIFFLFTNGVPLGMIWGMIFHYLEGRRTTEMLGAGLSVSFIFSAGFAKTVGGWLMRDWKVSEFWMPFATCCLYALPLLICLWLLDKVPPPTLQDEQLRTKRHPMSKTERIKFLAEFAPGIFLFILAYMFLTVFRDFRDNFFAELLKLLGYESSPELFTQTEIPISIIVLLIMGSLMFIKNNFTAFITNLVLIFAGLSTIGLSTLLFENKMIDPIAWMTATGLGLYLGYVPFNSLLFDRLIATFKIGGTVGFVIYVADAFGYLGSVGVLLIKEFSSIEISWLTFFVRCGYAISILGGLAIFLAIIYFLKKYQLSQALTKSQTSIQLEQGGKLAEVID